MPQVRRTPQQRDRRFARIRRLTQAIFLGSGVASVALVGYVASAAHYSVGANKTIPTTTTAPISPTTVPATSPTTVPTAESDDTGVTSTSRTPTTTIYTPPTAAPATTTTVCSTTPSGITTCY